MPEPDGAPTRAILLFLDGFGIGPPEPSRNPFLTARLPELLALLGGIPTLGPAGEAPIGTGSGTAAWTAADATFDVPGLPQSGTGQTSLLTGVEAPVRLGRHFGPWVPTALRPLLAAENILARAVERGWATAFANATPLSQVGGGEAEWRRPAAPPFAARAAGLPRRDAPELRAGRAVSSSITNERWQAHVDPTIPDISPAGAASVLAGIARDHRLTLFAHYDTDYVGHRGSFRGAVAALERVDEFVGALLRETDGETLLVIASDHGNVEDVSTGHTRNPVPIIAHGPGAARLISGITNISHVCPGILEALGGG